MPSSVEKAHEATKEQNGEVEAVPAGSDTAKLATVDLEPVLPEDLVPESDHGKVEEGTAGEGDEAAAIPEPEVGASKAGKEEAVASSDWNNAPVNGDLSGWTSVEAPAGAENGAAQVQSDAPPAAAAPESGVLGSGPSAAAPAVVEKGPMQVYNFYMVKVPRPADKQGKTEISSAEQQLQDKTDARDAHNRTVQAARVKRNEAFEKRKAARDVERGWLDLVKKKYSEVKPLRDSLKKMREAGRSVQQKSRDMPASEEELDRRIGGLEWRIQHESIPLKEEKQLMRDIKQLQSLRETVRANAAMFAQVHEVLGQREEVENALKPLEAEYRQLDLELQNAAKMTEQADKEYEQMDAALNAVQEKLQLANDKRQEAYVLRRSLKDQEYLKMTDFYNNKREIQEAKMMAIQANSRKAVEELCSAQVDRMLEMWSSNEEFRKNYVKDNEWSTARRLGGLDGRSLGPDEARPILGDGGHSAGPGAQQNGGQAGVSAKESASARAEKAETKEATKEVVTTATPTPTPTAVVEEKPTVKREAGRAAAASAPVVVEEVKSKEEVEREAAEMKEQRRITEMAKAKEAEERKRRIAERAQAKAQAWAQKEAERKEKEKEKKARKKAAAVMPTESDGLSDSGPAVADTTSESAADSTGSQEAVLEEVKVSSRQRKRGVTNSQKQAAKIARANGPMPPVRAKQQKVLGLSVPVLVGAGVGVAMLLVVMYLFVARGSSVWSSASGSGSGEFKEGARL